MTYIMNDDERLSRALTKSIHEAAQAPLKGGGGDRYDMLAWAFVRGFPLRRCERSHRVQTCGGRPANMHGQPVGPGTDRPDEKPYEHNLPSVRLLWGNLIRCGFLGGSIAKHGWADGPESSPEYKLVEAWIADPNGAVPAPPRRPRKPYVPAAAAAE